MRFRFSGHESFPCRYTWLPKAFRELRANPDLFANDNIAMVRLGVGKNMVKAIRFWVQAFDIAKVTNENSGLKTTPFGNSLLDQEGLDPFLEDIRTLWLLHWKISSVSEDPLFAWYFLLNKWPDPTFSRSEVIREFTRESERMERPLSDFTKTQHFDIFLHTYVHGRSKPGVEVIEDTLDCPLSELQFINPAGERIAGESGKREPVFEFNQGAKIEITGELFSYCLFDFWQKNRANEATISFKELSTIPGSLGNIFKLSEPDLRIRLESLLKDSSGMFEYISSASVPRIVKHSPLNDKNEKILMESVYGIKQKITQAIKPKKAHAD